MGPRKPSNIVFISNGLIKNYYIDVISKAVWKLEFLGNVNQRTFEVPHDVSHGKVLHGYILLLDFIVKSSGS